MSWFNWFKPKPKPPVQSPQTEFTVTVHAFEGDPARDSKIQGAHVVWDGQRPGTGFTDGAGNFTLPPMPRQGFNITVEGGQTDPPMNGTFGQHWIGVSLEHDTSLDFVLPFDAAPVHQPTVLSALHADGPLLRTADNAIYSIKWVSGFDAPRLVHLGKFDQLRLFTAWARDVGANGLRMFGGWRRTGFDFRYIPDYFTRVLPELNAFLKDEGLGGEFVCICDGIPSISHEQQDFINRCRDTVGDFLLVAEANEPWKNDYDPQAHTYPAGRLMTKGAPEAGTWPWPYLPSRGVTAHHSPRSEDWARKCGKDSYEIRGATNDVVFDEEPPGFAEALKPWSRVNNPHHAFVAGVGARMFSPGMVAHGDSDTMQLCNVPGPIETECARRCFEGIDFVPAEAPTWTYARYGPSNPGVPMPVEDDVFPSPGRITDHLHAMIGPGKAIVCNYYPSQGWVAKGANGWRVVKQDEGAVLCER